MTTKLTFKRLGAPLEKAAPLPPEPNRDGSYGLVYAPALDAIVYAPSTESHGAGVGWTYAGSFEPFATKTARGSSVDGPYTAVWDTKRKAVVVWAWDYTPGPIGFVLKKGGAPQVLSNSERADVTLRGEHPTRADDTEWEASALFGFDPKRGVTVCVNQAGLWELDDTTWARREVDLSALPNEAKSSGYRASDSCGSFYDPKHERVVFFAVDEGVITFVAWDGEALTRLDSKGLPEVASFGGKGFAVGPHGDFGVAVLHATGELFALTGAKGGFKSLGTAPGAPTDFSHALLAWHPTRKELLLGPQRTRTKSHRLFVFDGSRWKTFGRTVEHSPIETAGLRFALSANGEGYAVSIRGAVAVWDDAGAKWSMLITEKEAGLGAPLQIADAMWGGELHCATNDGAVYRLERKGDKAAWAPVVKKSKDFGASTWPLGAFDVARQQLVVWGDTKASGKGRKNDTFVCDGKKWSKAKKSPAPKDADHHTMIYAPAEQCVLRLSKSEVASFDGAVWKAVSHKGGDKATAWRMTACVPSEGPVLFVKEHLSEREVVRFERKGASWVFSTVATFTEPKLEGDASDRNSAFDLGWFDAPRRRLVVHFKHDATESHALDLGALLKK